MRVFRHSLSLAATPTFALMALLNGIDAGGNAHLLCSAATAGLSWTGMTTMYWVMSLFHLAPWLKFATPQCTGERAIR